MEENQIPTEKRERAELSTPLTVGIDEWYTAWPTEPGYYWFAGWPFRFRDREPELHFVKVRKISNGIAFITNGRFLYQQEGAFGAWMKADVPIPPWYLIKQAAEKSKVNG